MSTKRVRKRTRKANDKASRANFGERARKKLKKRGKKKNRIKRAPEARKPSVAFMRPVQPDDKLSAIVGSKPLLRSELTKKLWDYIKKNGCQDKKKRTMINADDTLRPVFNGKSQVSMFQMMKLTSGHIK